MKKSANIQSESVIKEAVVDNHTIKSSQGFSWLYELKMTIGTWAVTGNHRTLTVYPVRKKYKKFKINFAIGLE